MNQIDNSKVQDLLRRLEQLEAQHPEPQEVAGHLVAQRALIDQIRQLVQQHGLSVYRNGRNLDVVSLT